MDRIILHCDCNCFYASCELLSRPELRQLPVAVCGDPTERHGIRSAPVSFCCRRIISFTMNIRRRSTPFTANTPISSSRSASTKAGSM